MLASALYYEKAEWLIAFALFLIFTLLVNVFREESSKNSMSKLNDSMYKYVVSMVIS